MRAVVLAVLVARVAAASPFTLRMPASDALAVVETISTLPPTENVRDVMAADPDLAGVKIERLARVHTAVAFIAVPALPRRVRGRALIAAVDALARDGTFVTLRFYVDSMDHAARWASVARDVASTLEIHPEPSQPPVHVIERAHPPLPAGWSLRADSWFTRITSPHGECKIIDGELDVHASAPGNATKVPDDLWKDTVYWSVWSNAQGQHAELVTGAKHWGTLHATCTASTKSALYQLRKAVVDQLQ